MYFLTFSYNNSRQRDPPLARRFSQIKCYYIENWLSLKQLLRIILFAGSEKENFTVSLAISVWNIAVLCWLFRRLKKDLLAQISVFIRAIKGRVIGYT